MFLLCFLFEVNSISHSDTISAGASGYTEVPENYDEINLNIAAGEGLMMVEWANSPLTISIPDIGVANQHFVNSMGYSLFTFKNDARVNIKVNSKITYFYFPGPHIQTGAAYQFISNYKSNDIKVNTNYDLYFGTYGKYDLTASFSRGQTGHVMYYRSKWTDTAFSGSFNLVGLEYFTILHDSNTVTYSGTVRIDSQKTYTPTVPTKVGLTVKDVKSNQYKINENMAYGGDVDNGGKSIKMIDLFKKRYSNILSDLDDKYTLYYRDEHGSYKSFTYLNRDGDADFETEIFVTSSKCESYTFVKRIASTGLKIGDNGYIVNETITKDMIPKNCIHKKSVNGGVIASIILAILLVIAIVVFVVIIVLMRKKANSEQEGRTAEHI